MFDVYMDAHAIDPRARRKMMALVTVAAMATTVSLASALVGERLGITRVAAPKVEGILVMPADEMPALASSPPPGPPPEPDPIDDVADPETPPDDPRPTIRDTAPIERGPTSRTTGPHNGVPGPTHSFVPGPPVSIGCAVPGTCARIPPPRPTPTTPKEKPSFESIDVARERAIATPDPSHEKLSRTPAGLARRSGTSRVAFCIDTNGKTIDVRTRKSAGDEEVDRICRDTVKLWRFHAREVEGRPRVTCSEVSFQIAFE